MVFPAFDTNISIQQEDSSFIFNNVKVIEQLESIPILNVPNIKEASNSNSIL